MPILKDKETAQAKFDKYVTAMEARIKMYQDHVQEQQDRYDRLKHLTDIYGRAIINRSKVDYFRGLPGTDIIFGRELWMYAAHIQIRQMLDEEVDIVDIIDALNALHSMILKYSDDIEAWMKFTKSYLSGMSQDVQKSSAAKFLLEGDTRFPHKIDYDYKAFKFAKQVSDFSKWVEDPKNWSE